ncbi:hypothetical protein AAEX28_14695 [Lentisphaerota bacterium WC36G]|nr:hypothetical protein LJT99_01450 [Lentisphaerae bacterium WC36]
MVNFFNVKVLMLLILAHAVSVLFSGCATSKRMNRLSPWQQQIVKDIDAETINLWPIYYQNSSGTSVLWPMVDVDKKGFGIRPFFNKEENEYAVLFPLIAWNPVNGDGWAVPAYWGQNYFGVFPLGHFGDNFSYASIVYWNKKTDSYGLFPLTHIGKNLSYAGPVYWDKDSYGFFPLTRYSNNGTSYIGPVYWNDKSYGVFPFAHKTDNYSYCLNTYIDDEQFVFFPLAYAQKNGISYATLAYWDNDCWGVFPLAHYNQNSLSFVGNFYWNSAEKRYGLLPIGQVSENLSFVGPVYWDNDSYGLLPVAHHSDKFSFIGPTYWGDGYQGIFPISHIRDNKLSYAGPVYWNSSQEYYGLFPLFHKDKKWTLAFPYYSSVDKDYYCEYNRETDTSKEVEYYEEFSSIIPLFYRKTSQREELNTLLPIYLYSHNKKNHDKFLVTPLGGSYIDGENYLYYSWLLWYGKYSNSRLFFTPLYGQYSEDENVSMRAFGINSFVYNSHGKEDNYSIFWPFINYSHQKDTAKNDGFYAFPFISVNSKTPALLFKSNDKEFSFLSYLGYNYEKLSYGFKQNILLLGYTKEINDQQKRMETNNYSGAEFEYATICDKSYMFFNNQKYSWRFFPVNSGEKSKVLKFKGADSYKFETDCKHPKDYQQNLYGFWSLLQDLRGEFRHLVDYLEFKTHYKNRLDDKGANIEYLSKSLKRVKVDIEKTHEKIAKLNLKFVNLNSKLKLDFKIPLNLNDVEVICKNMLENYTDEVDYYQYNSIFMQKTQFNNDYEWNFLWFLAQGRQQDDFETVNILQYLYRYERVGNKESRNFFPAISYFKDKDENKSKLSFFWRLLNLEKDNDKTKGHILFIPFGH